VLFRSKWKTVLQMVAIGFLLAGGAGDKIWPYTTMFGLTLLWVAAILTLYTGYDYLCAAWSHVMTDKV
jgi:cardiolipin synthase (CMP-forming)